MAENYKHLYEQTKKMLTMYQDELIPGFRKQIEDLEAKSKWIPVTERLPEQYETVIGWTKYKEMGEVSHNGKCFMWEDDSGDYAHVTHWMPLPEPPKEVE